MPNSSAPFGENSSEDIFRLAVQSVPAAIVLYDADQRILFANSRACEMLGKPPDRIIGNRDIELVPFAINWHYVPLLRQAIETHEPQHGEYALSLKDGEHTRTVVYTPLLNEHGEITAVLSVTEDITAERETASEIKRLDHELAERAQEYEVSNEELTIANEELTDLNEELADEIAERKRVEAELSASRQLLQDLIDSTPALIMARDLNGRLILLNNALAHFYGMPKEKALGTTDYDIFPPEVADTFTANHAKVLTSGAPLAHEELIVQNGVPHEFMSYKFPLRDSTGRIYGLASVNTDISAIRRAEKELRQLSMDLAERVAELQTIMDVAPVGIAIGHDPEGRIITANRTLSNWLEASPEANISLSVPERERTVSYSVVRDGQEVPPDELPVQYAAENGASLRDSQFRIVHPDGRTIDLLANAEPLYDEQGQVSGAVATFIDITARLRAEQERDCSLQSAEAARLVAEQALALRDKFIAVASHELKTPLTSIHGYAQLLKQRAGPSLSPDALRMIDTIERQVARLGTMISALLDISRIEQGQLSLNPVRIDLNAFVTTLVREIEPSIRMHKLILTLSDGTVPVDADPLRLEQAIQNLVGNAVKYSPLGGPIDIAVHTQGRMACLSVSDRGIGIPADSLPKLFDRFYRAPNAEANSINGLGVGLYVVREIIRLHGGDVTVESQENMGSTFTITLPLAIEG